MASFNHYSPAVGSTSSRCPTIGSLTLHAGPNPSNTHSSCTNATRSMHHLIGAVDLLTKRENPSSMDSEATSTTDSEHVNSEPSVNQNGTISEQSVPLKRYIYDRDPNPDDYDNLKIWEFR
ncbi:hypothetical protein PIB30_079923 [Stylosanthes scabra]|uniref:Uncharacterized protein n=1 Tax=Stylosanthes scabra TaxID=79078 RepID=A0ABU6SS43_9FABA|nr:hypothetical protein [Stylosanthes scabra]